MTRDRDLPPCLRWMRIIAIASAALILASCRPASGAEPARLARRGDGPVAPSPSAERAVVRTGLEAPCPPLPRVGAECAACRGRRPAPGCRACRTCGPAATCPTGACATGACPTVICLPGSVPRVAPCLVCDGGDAGAPAKPVGADGLRNLTAGDTVARYQADEGPDAAEVHIATSNCACVFAPRFASVREVVRPFEDAAPQGPRGLALDEHPDEEALRLPVIQRAQALQPEAARKALPGVAIQERLGPLAVDQGDMPHEDQGRVQPAARVAMDQPELARRSQRPHVAVGFAVPVAWTCVKAANVIVDGRSAEVVAADRGTATLRFEEPGRAELTLCKQAGSDTARPGEELDFTIYVLNSGDRELADVVLADALPLRLSFVEGSAAASLPADFSAAPGDDGATVLTWRLREPLPAGGSGFVRFRTIVR
ncbi:MAG: hypothetical protein ACKOSQ_11725 [Planctomycetaceae bacterium]